MTQPITNILVLRLLSNMAQAISTQNITISALGCMGRPEEFADPTSLPRNLQIATFDFGLGKTVFARFHDLLVLGKFIKKQRPDIIHVNALNDLLPAFLISNLFIPRCKRPAIIAMSHNPQVWKNPTKAWIAARFIQFFADGFVALATTHKNQLISLGIPAELIAVIPISYDIDSLQQDNLANLRFINPAKSPRVVFTATIMARKAQDVLLRAAGLVLQRHPNVCFDLVGGVLSGEETYANELHTIVNELNISSQVRFAGYVPYQEIPSYLANSDIFAFPSYSEMMPRAVIEAMLAGKPVVASGVDGICDLVQNRKTGLLVPPGQVQDLADAISELIEKPSLATELGSAGREYILKQCSREHVGELQKNFYQTILDNKRCRCR